MLNNISRTMNCFRNHHSWVVVVIIGLHSQLPVSHGGPLEERSTADCDVDQWFADLNHGDIFHSSLTPQQRRIRKKVELGVKTHKRRAESPCDVLALYKGLIRRNFPSWAKLEDGKKIGDVEKEIAQKEDRAISSEVVNLSDNLNVGKIGGSHGSDIGKRNGERNSNLQTKESGDFNAVMEPGGCHNIGGGGTPEKTDLVRDPGDCNGVSEKARVVQKGSYDDDERDGSSLKQSDTKVQDGHNAILLDDGAVTFDAYNEHQTADRGTSGATVQDDDILRSVSSGIYARTDAEYYDATGSNGEYKEAIEADEERHLNADEDALFSTNDDDNISFDDESLGADDDELIDATDNESLDADDDAFLDADDESLDAHDEFLDAHDESFDADDKSLEFDEDESLDADDEFLDAHDESLDFDEDESLDFDEDESLDFDEDESLDFDEDESLDFDEDESLDFDEDESLDAGEDESLDADEDESLAADDEFLNVNDDEALDANDASLGANDNELLDANDDESLDVNDASLDFDEVESLDADEDESRDADDESLDADDEYLDANGDELIDANDDESLDVNDASLDFDEVESLDADEDEPLDADDESLEANDDESIDANDASLDADDDALIDANDDDTFDTDDDASLDANDDDTFDADDDESLGANENEFLEADEDESLDADEDESLDANDASLDTDEDESLDANDDASLDADDVEYIDANDDNSLGIDTNIDAATDDTPDADIDDTLDADAADNADTLDVYHEGALNVPDRHGSDNRGDVAVDVNPGDDDSDALLDIDKDDKLDVINTMLKNTSYENADVVKSTLDLVAGEGNGTKDVAQSQVTKKFTELPYEAPRDRIVGRSENGTMMLWGALAAQWSDFCSLSVTCCASEMCGYLALWLHVCILHGRPEPTRPEISGTFWGSVSQTPANTVNSPPSGLEQHRDLTFRIDPLKVENLYLLDQLRNNARDSTTDQLDKEIRGIQSEIMKLNQLVQSMQGTETNSRKSEGRSLETLASAHERGKLSELEDVLHTHSTEISKLTAKLGQLENQNNFLLERLLNQSTLINDLFSRLFDLYTQNRISQVKTQKIEEEDDEGERMRQRFDPAPLDAVTYQRDEGATQNNCGTMKDDSLIPPDVSGAQGSDAILSAGASKLLQPPNMGEPQTVMSSPALHLNQVSSVTDPEPERRDIREDNMVAHTDMSQNTVTSYTSNTGSSPPDVKKASDDHTVSENKSSQGEVNDITSQRDTTNVATMTKKGNKVHADAGRKFNSIHKDQRKNDSSTREISPAKSHKSDGPVQVSNHESRKPASTKAKSLPKNITATARGQQTQFKDGANAPVTSESKSKKLKQKKLSPTKSVKTATRPEETNDKQLTTSNVTHNARKESQKDRLAVKNTEANDSRGDLSKTKNSETKDSISVVKNPATKKSSTDNSRVKDTRAKDSGSKTSRGKDSAAGKTAINDATGKHAAGKITGPANPGGNAAEVKDSGANRFESSGKKDSPIINSVSEKTGSKNGSKPDQKHSKTSRKSKNGKNDNETNVMTASDISDKKTQSQDTVRTDRPLYSNPTFRGQKDCYDHYALGRRRDMALKVTPVGAPDRPVSAFCDMKGGGWTVILRRTSGATDFYRHWKDYKEGFGGVVVDHWLGNDVIHLLTNQGNYSLRIDLTDWERRTAVAHYEVFRIDGESQGYRLTVSGFSGSAGDGLSKHDGHQFSTRDVDNDALTSEQLGGSCAQRFTGAWWYYKCYQSNLTGRYYRGGAVAEGMFDGVAWKPWTGSRTSLKKVEMKIRPRHAGT